MVMTGAEELILRNQIAIMTGLLNTLHKPGSPVEDEHRLLMDAINKTHVALHKVKVLR